MRCLQVRFSPEHWALDDSRQPIPCEDLGTARRPPALDAGACGDGGAGGRGCGARWTGEITNEMFTSSQPAETCGLSDFIDCREHLDHMDSPALTQPGRAPTLVASILAFLLWLGVLALLAKWSQAWATGRLEPGASTSLEPLALVFLVAAVASVGGIFLSVRAWRGRSQVKWQALSMLGAALALWAVSGN